MEFRSAQTAGTKVGLWTTVVKPADTSRNTTITITADPDLKFSMLASTKYSFRMRAFLQVGATEDFKYRHVGPASPTLVRILRDHIVGAGAAWVPALDTAYSAADVQMLGAAGMGLVQMSGIIENGVNAGPFEFHWAQVTSGATATIVRGGSWLEYAVI